jgi:hypothetical protein
MGSHPTLAHPTPERDVEGLSAQLARQRRIAEFQPTERDLEQAFD